MQLTHTLTCSPKHTHLHTQIIQSSTHSTKLTHTIDTCTLLHAYTHSYTNRHPYTINLYSHIHGHTLTQNVIIYRHIWTHTQLYTFTQKYTQLAYSYPSTQKHTSTHSCKCMHFHKPTDTYNTLTSQIHTLTLIHHCVSTAVGGVTRWFCIAGNLDFSACPYTVFKNQGKISCSQKGIGYYGFPVSDRYFSGLKQKTKF